MSNLKELREEWEKKLNIFGEIPISDSSFIVILMNDSNDISPLKEYHMHRYFKLGDKWQISVDSRSTSLHDILAVMVSINQKYGKCQ